MAQRMQAAVALQQQANQQQQFSEEFRRIAPEVVALNSKHEQQVRQLYEKQNKESEVVIQRLEGAMENMPEEEAIAGESMLREMRRHISVKESVILEIDEDGEQD